MYSFHMVLLSGMICMKVVARNTPAAKQLAREKSSRGALQRHRHSGRKLNPKAIAKKPTADVPLTRINLFIKY